MDPFELALNNEESPRRQEDRKKSSTTRFLAVLCGLSVFVVRTVVPMS
jgi:hypothetical protein